MTPRTASMILVIGLCAAIAQAGISATGDVVPADPATWTDSTEAYVGDTGVGSVTVDGGSDLLSHRAHLGYGIGSDGTVTVDGAGSTWANSFVVHVGYYGDGPLRLYDGGMAAVDSAVYVNTTGTLEIGLSGAATESRLDAGSAWLAGALEVSLLDGYAPTPGDEFLIIDSAYLRSTFKTITLPSTQWYIDYDYANDDVIVGLSVAGDCDHDGDVDDADIDLLADAIRLGSTDPRYDISADGMTGGADGVVDRLDLDYLIRFLVETEIGTGTEYGDFNLDGVIDAVDQTRLATNFGPGSTWAEGNANRNLDLVIDTTDLAILGTYFAFGLGGDSIPEPASLGLLALGGLVTLMRRKR